MAIITDVMPTIDNVIGRDETPKREACSIIDLYVVGKVFNPLKNSKPNSAMLPRVVTNPSNSDKNILYIL